MPKQAGAPIGSNISFLRRLLKNKYMCDILSYVRQNIIVRSVRCLHSLISSTRYAKPSSKVPGSARTMYLMFGLFGDTQEPRS